MITSNSHKIAASKTELDLYRDAEGKVLGQSVRFHNSLYSNLTGDIRGTILMGSTVFSAQEIPAKFIILVNGESTVDFVGLYESDEHKAKLVDIGVKVDGYTKPEPVVEA